MRNTIGFRYIKITKDYLCDTFPVVENYILFSAKFKTSHNGGNYYPQEGGSRYLLYFNPRLSYKCDIPSDPSKVNLKTHWRQPLYNLWHEVIHGSQNWELVNKVEDEILLYIETTSVDAYKSFVYDYGELIKALEELARFETPNDHQRMNVEDETVERVSETAEHIGDAYRTDYDEGFSHFRHVKNPFVRLSKRRAIKIDSGSMNNTGGRTQGKKQRKRSNQQLERKKKDSQSKF